MDYRERRRDLDRLRDLTPACVLRSIAVLRNWLELPGSASGLVAERLEQGHLYALRPVWGQLNACLRTSAINQVNLTGRATRVLRNSRAYDVGPGEANRLPLPAVIAPLLGGDGPATTVRAPRDRPCDNAHPQRTRPGRNCYSRRPECAAKHRSSVWSALIWQAYWAQCRVSFSRTRSPPEDFYESKRLSCAPL